MSAFLVQARILPMECSEDVNTTFVKWFDVQRSQKQNKRQFVWLETVMKKMSMIIPNLRGLPLFTIVKRD